jgi:nitroreductase
MRSLFKVFFHLLSGVCGFAYDLWRYVRYASWRLSVQDAEVRGYYSVLVYHALEKSLSYQTRRANAGWRNAELLLRVLQAAEQSGNASFHDCAARGVLEEFLALPENSASAQAALLREGLARIGIVSEGTHGSMLRSRDDYEKGMLPDPEAFFFSRYSLREFEKAPVPREIIERAVGLAIKTPSVCNRQPWKVYHTADPEVRDVVLRYQSGNSPFGQHIPNLMVITVDLKAFFFGQEHYQHWIDGGLFSMSLIYALHSLGVASCPLNWSQTPSKDRQLRRLVGIAPNHTIIMALGLGFPSSTNKVCVSARKPISAVLMELEKRKCE